MYVSFESYMFNWETIGNFISYYYWAYKIIVLKRTTFEVNPTYQQNVHDKFIDLTSRTL